ncbi:MAG: hypothetical protein L3J67_02420 [Hyphomicrobiaceae bacterium]|nr:hypothetical protein [Hyphomicrobiaceae bacterium]
MPENAKKMPKNDCLAPVGQAGYFCKKINDGQRFKSGPMSTGLNSLEKMLVSEPDRS